MKGAVVACEARIKAALERLYPGAVDRVAVRPLADLALGDLVFDGCFALGAELKRAPEEIAHELVASLGVDPRFTWSPAEGFLNIRLEESVDLLGEWAPPYDGFCPATVIVPARTEAVSLGGFHRLAGAAVIQTVIARRWGGGTNLSIGGESTEGGSQDDLLTLVAAQSGVRAGAVARAGLERVLAACGERQTVWLAPTFFERGAFRDFYRRYCTPPGTVTLRCPPRGWLEGFQEEWGIRPERDGSVGAHLVLLAGGRRPEELDPAVPRLGEQGNLPWFLTTTRARLERFRSGEIRRPTDSAPGGAVAGVFDSVVRRVAVRSATVRYFEWLAATQGEVSVWLDVVADLLRATNQFVNSPHYRRMLTVGAEGNVSIQILSGALGAVSDTIAGNPLFDEMGEP